jgi:hypothetical protein
VLLDKILSWALGILVYYFALRYMYPEGIPSRTRRKLRVLKI